MVCHSPLYYSVQILAVWSPIFCQKSLTLCLFPSLVIPVVRFLSFPLIHAIAHFVGAEVNYVFLLNSHFLWIYQDVHSMN